MGKFSCFFSPQFCGAARIRANGRRDLEVAACHNRIVVDREPPRQDGRQWQTQWPDAISTRTQHRRTTVLGHGIAPAVVLTTTSMCRRHNVKDCAPSSLPACVPYVITTWSLLSILRVLFHCHCPCVLSLWQEKITTDATRLFAFVNISLLPPLPDEATKQLMSLPWQLLAPLVLPPTGVRLVFHVVYAHNLLRRVDLPSLVNLCCEKLNQVRWRQSCSFCILWPWWPSNGDHHLWRWWNCRHSHRDIIGSAVSSQMSVSAAASQDLTQLIFTGGRGKQQMATPITLICMSLTEAMETCLPLADSPFCLDYFLRQSSSLKVLFWRVASWWRVNSKGGCDTIQESSWEKIKYARHGLYIWRKLSVVNFEADA